MNLGKKWQYAKQHIESIMRHDDEPLAAREALAKRITQCVEDELAAAKTREATAIEDALKE